jgi:hypothetical protein
MLCNVVPGKETRFDRTEFDLGDHTSIPLIFQPAATNAKLSRGKLLNMLARKRYLDKAGIASRYLYDRPYNGLRDDKRIYYHIHSLRKRSQIDSGSRRCRRLLNAALPTLDEPN